MNFRGSEGSLFWILDFGITVLDGEYSGWFRGAGYLPEWYFQVSNLRFEI
jgi:hypothetical protein